MVPQLLYTDEEGMYDSPSVSTQPLPAIPPTGDKEEEEDGVYEAILGDNSQLQYIRR